MKNVTLPFFTEEVMLEAGDMVLVELSNGALVRIAINGDKIKVQSISGPGDEGKNRTAVMRLCCLFPDIFLIFIDRCAPLLSRSGFFKKNLVVSSLTPNFI